MNIDKAIPQLKTVEKVITISERMEGCLFWDDIIEDQPVECEIADTDRDDLARLLYSSGTNGLPKGAIAHMVDICVLGCVHGKNMTWEKKPLVPKNNIYYGLYQADDIVRDDLFEETYSLTGRLSIPPSLLVKALLLQYYDNVPDREAENHGA